MRGYYHGYGPQVAHYGFGFPYIFEFFFLLFIVVFLVDAILFGFWLWKQLQKR
ncbi:hypothetical protein M1615_02310 [Patescibacteria group bacterium]|nr:hypothetical protein [Patescibacteria group bacterium]